MNCLNCQAPTPNPKFCSVSCAASYNNKIKPKRTKTTYYCKVCNTPIRWGSKYCKEHSMTDRIAYRTLGDFVKCQSRRPSIYSSIREQARRIGKKLGMNKCQKCGYDKHIEICHIKSISSFPPETLISEINSPDNLIALCPNHHWELDNSSE